MFIPTSNFPCNNAPFNALMMQCMNRTNPKHPTYSRLEHALSLLGKDSSPSAIARQLNVSDQTVTNWASPVRGISKEGMFAIEAEFGISASWLKTGQGIEVVLNAETLRWARVFQESSQEERRRSVAGLVAARKPTANPMNDTDFAGDHFPPKKKKRQ